VIRRTLQSCFALALSLVVAPRIANAGASILGFSVGEDTMTLSALLTQAIQQVAVLRDIREMTVATQENIAFVRDVYETGHDVAEGNWAQLSEQFLTDVMMRDENLREIYRNTENIVNDRVPRGNAFRRLVGAGFNQLVFDTFGPYPFGQKGEAQALIDYRIINLNSLAEDRLAAMRDANRRVAEAMRDCSGKFANLERCTKAGAKMQTESAAALQDLVALQATQMQLQAAKDAVENGEKKRRAAAMQRDLDSIGRAFDRTPIAPLGLVVPGQ